MTYKDCDYSIVIAVVYMYMVFQTYNIGETHHSAEVMSTFAFGSGTTALVLASTFIGSTALRKANEDSDYTTAMMAAISFVFLVAAIAHSTQTAWLSRDVH